MKTMLQRLGVAFLALAAISLAAQPAAAQEWPSSVTVMGKELALAFKEEKAGGLLLEYIPAGETLQRWSIMFAMRHFDIRTLGENADPMKYALAQEKLVRQRQPRDPVANAMTLQHKDGKSFFVDFVISDGEFIEHNIFRYFRTAEGLTSYQIARRAAYGDASEALLLSIRPERNNIMNTLMNMEIPTPEIAPTESQPPAATTDNSTSGG